MLRGRPGQAQQASVDDDEDADQQQSGQDGSGDEQADSQPDSDEAEFSIDSEGDPASTMACVMTTLPIPSAMPGSALLQTSPQVCLWPEIMAP